MDIWIGIGVTGLLALAGLASTWGVVKWRIKHAEANLEKLWERYDCCSKLQADRYSALDKRLEVLDTILGLLKTKQQHNHDESRQEARQNRREEGPR